jgi:hypothetical protein
LWRQALAAAFVANWLCAISISDYRYAVEIASKGFTYDVAQSKLAE